VGESGVDYVLDVGTGGESIPLAAMEWHFRRPALAWPGLVAAAQQPDQDHTLTERQLLLLAASTDSDRPSGATDTVDAALTSVGARSSERQVAQQPPLLGPMPVGHS
jgi:hypothetical protein